MESRTSVYSPLDKTRKSIRLLQINPSQSNNDSVTCTLTPFIVDEECPPYIALSYTWGRRPPKHEIQVNGHAFQVRPNLWSALHQLPDCKGGINASYFWIDAICIDQTDNSERNHQVAMMRDIYQSATAVFAWLGPRFPNSDLAMEALRHNEPELHNDAEPASPPSREALNRLFNNVYFTRLWVVQEFLLAKDLWIICGAQMCTWAQFQTTFFWKSQTQIVRDLIRAKARDHATLHMGVKDAVSLGLLEAISIFRFRDCSEVRDKVYGLLGIIPECEVHLANFKIDYEISIERLFYFTVNWLRAVNTWLWTQPQVAKYALYDRLGKQLQVDSQIVNAQKLMDQVIVYIAYPGISEPRPTRPGSVWSMECFKEKAYELLTFAEIDIDGAISVDETFESLMQNTKISGGLDEPAGWRAYQSEIKAALRLINGESWEEIGPILQKEKPIGCCCGDYDFRYYA